MKAPSRRPALLFVLLLLALAAPTLWRTWELRLLYADGGYRARSQAALTKAAEREGWLLSDLEMRAASSGSLTVIHHEHRRGLTPSACLILSLQTSTFTPCAK
jgi:hypothetical protein